MFWQTCLPAMSGFSVPLIHSGMNAMKEITAVPKRITVTILLIVSIATLMSACSAKDVKPEQNVYIAWSNNQESYSFISTLRAVEAAGAKPVVMEQAMSYDLHYDSNGELTEAEENEHGILTSEAAKKVKINTWQNSNVEEIMKDVDCVIFPGGSDICPTLYYDEQDWHGIEDDTDYSAERDVSDYILISYCLENDIPVLAICRGMQMLSIVSGADMIQDLGQWYEGQGLRYSNDHRDAKKENFAAHSVTIISRDSHLYRITGRETLSKVPSWHHQAVGSTDNTRLAVTAQAETDGMRVIEGVERPDKTFCIGVQFHPEVAVRKNLEKEKDAESYMDYDTALSLFRALIDASHGKV